MVVCGDEVVHNVAAMDDATGADGVVAADVVLVAVGAVDAVNVWVQQCWMRACTNLQSHLVLTMVTLRGKNSSWWYHQTT